MIRIMGIIFIVLAIELVIALMILGIVLLLTILDK